MAKHVYPDPQTAPQTVGANSTFPALADPVIPIDLSVGTGTSKTMRLVMLPGAPMDPFVIFKADSGEEVTVQPNGFPFAVFNLPGGAGAEVLDVVMVLDDPAAKIYKLELTVNNPATYGIRIVNNDTAANHDFTWVVADNDADSQQPWIKVVTPSLNFNVLTNQSVPLAVEIENLGTGPLQITDNTGLGVGTGFTLTGVPGPIVPNQAVPASVQITFTGPAAAGQNSGSYSITSNEPPTENHNHVIALTATTGKLEIALVLDGSASMGSAPNGTAVTVGQSSRWDWLKSATTDLLDLLNTFATSPTSNPYGHFAIDVFPDLVSHASSPNNSAQIQGVQDITTPSIVAAKAAVTNAPAPWNNTPMADGMGRAFGYFDIDTMAEPFNVEYNRRFMILMSDGWDNGPTDPLTLAGQFAALKLNALTIGFGLTSATIYPVNWGLLNTIAGWSPGGAFHNAGADDMGTSVEGVMGRTLHKVFAVALSTALSLVWAMDPTDTLTAASPEKRYTINVLPYDNKVAFVVRWTTPGRLVEVEVETPNCEIITAASAKTTAGVFYSSGSLYQIFSFDQSYLRNTSGRARDGAWNLLVSIVDAPTGGNEIFDYSVVLDSRLRMDVKFGQNIYHAGDTVGLTATLTLDGLPIRHATVIVEQAAPGQSLDNFLANSVVTADDLSKATAAAATTDYTAIGLRAFAIQLKGQVFNVGKAPSSKPMTDSGNAGVYQASFSNSSVPGNYEYYVVAIGQTADGVTFRREQQLYLRLDPNPVPAYTVVDTFYHSSYAGAASSASITIYPRDRFPNALMFDPLYDHRLSFSAQNAQLTGGLVFNGNGSYTQQITFLPGATPTVQASMNGVAIVPPQTLVAVSTLKYPDTVLSYAAGREAMPGANTHSDPTVLLGNPTVRVYSRFLSLGAMGSVAVSLKGQVIVAQGANDVTIFAYLDNDLRSYKVEALPENQTTWVLLGTSSGTTQSFALSAAGLKTASAVRITDTSGRNRNFGGSVSNSPGFSCMAVGFASTGAPSQVPVIQAPNGVINAASFLPGLSAGSWAAVRGTNLSLTTRTWGPADIVNNKLPTQSDGVAVTFNGKPGYVYYISPTQINVVVPGIAAGAVNVQVTGNNGSSQVVSLQAGTVSPGLFLVLQDQKYVEAFHADGSIVGNPNLVPGAKCAPAIPGETITLTGTGFGPTKPPEPEGMVVTTPSPLASAVTLTIGGVKAVVASAIMHDIATITFTVVVPAALKAGDAPVVATVAGVQSEAGVMLTIGAPVLI